MIMRLPILIMLLFSLTGCTGSHVKNDPSPYPGLPKAQDLQIDGIFLGDSLETVRGKFPNSFVRDQSGRWVWDEASSGVIFRQDRVCRILGGKVLREGKFELRQGDSVAKVLSTFPSFRAYIEPDVETADFNNIRLRDAGVLNIGIDEGKVLDFSLTQRK